MKVGECKDVEDNDVTAVLCTYLCASKVLLPCDQCQLLSQHSTGFIRTFTCLHSTVTLLTSLQCVCVGGGGGGMLVYFKLHTYYTSSTQDPTHIAGLASDDITKHPMTSQNIL